MVFFTVTNTNSNYSLQSVPIVSYMIFFLLRNRLRGFCSWLHNYTFLNQNKRTIILISHRSTLLASRARHLSLSKKIHFGMGHSVLLLRSNFFTYRACINKSFCTSGGTERSAKVSTFLTLDVGNAHLILFRVPKNSQTSWFHDVAGTKHSTLRV